LVGRLQRLLGEFIKEHLVEYLKAAAKTSKTGPAKRVKTSFDFGFTPVQADRWERTTEHSRVALGFMKSMDYLTEAATATIAQIWLFLSDEVPQQALAGFKDKDRFLNPFWELREGATDESPSSYKLKEESTRYTHFNRRLEEKLGLKGGDLKKNLSGGNIIRGRGSKIGQCGCML
jgi:hypothetical protein